MFELGKFCARFYLQVLVNLRDLCFSGPDGFIPTHTALLSLDKFNTRQSKMVSPHQTMVRTSVLWMHYLSSDCSRDGLPGKGKLNMCSIDAAFQTCVHMHSSQRLRSDIIFVPFLKSTVLVTDCENFEWLRNSGALFSYELNCSIKQKNLNCNCKLVKVLLPTSKPLSTLDSDSAIFM